MEITINEDSLKLYIEEAVNKKVDDLTDEIIKEKVYGALLDKVTGIFNCYDRDIKLCVDKHVRELITERVPMLNKELLDEVGEGIARKIAFELKENILTSIAYRLMPDDEEDE